MHRLRVLRVSGSTTTSAQALASALAASDIDVRLVTPVERPGETPAGLARRLEPLEVSTPVGPVEITYYEGQLPGGGVSVAVAECDAQTLGAFALELCRSMDQWPHVVHASADTADVVPLAKQAPIAPVAVVGMPGSDPTAAIDESLERALTAADRIAVDSAAIRKTATSGDGVLARLSDRVCSIEPGVDRARWDPRRDPHIEARFSPSDWSGKAECKRSLQRELGLAVRARIPLIGVAGDGRALVDAQGGPLAKLRFQIASDRGDPQLRHRIAAGADFAIVGDVADHPLFFTRYGTVPIAEREAPFTLSLVDFHRATRTGNAFLYGSDEHGLATAVRRAVKSYATDTHAVLVQRAFDLDLSWETAAFRYQELYRRALLS